MNTLRVAVSIACLGTAATAFAQGTSEVLAALGQEQAFVMSNGARLVVQPRVNSVRIRYDNRSPAVLHADGQGAFVSGDGQLSLKVALDAAGRASDVSLTLPAHP